MEARITGAIFMIVVVVSSVSANDYCTYFHNRAPSREPQLTMCNRYRENSCCQPDEERIGFDVDPVFHRDITSQCAATLSLLRCWICHPQQSIFYNNETLTVCPGLCNDILSDCGDSAWRDRRVRNYYRNGRELCEEMGFNVQNTDCFTAAATKGLASKLTTLVTLLAGFLLTGLLSKSQLNMGMIVIVLTIVLLAVPSHAQTSRSNEVIDWAQRVSLFIQELADEQLLVDEAQDLFDNAEYDETVVDGMEVVEQVREELRTFAADKLNALDRMRSTILEEYDQFNEPLPDSPEQFPFNIYRDSDVSEHLPDDQLTFDRRFEYTVDFNQSSVKIAGGLNRSDEDLLRQIRVSAALDPIFKENLANDSFISYQFYGSESGFMRAYPGRPWQRNVIGMREDFDPRFRPWFVGATSGPKDVVIVLDMSRSMGDFRGRRWRIALRTVQTLLSTLTRDDYVNVIGYRTSYWDYDSNRFVFPPFNVMGCRQTGLQPATAAHQEELMANIREFNPRGGSNPQEAFTRAYTMLGSTPRTNCQQFVLWVTDEARRDDDVRCGPGRYVSTDDGTEYIPGPICRWTDEYERLLGIVDRESIGKVRTFTFSILPKDRTYAAEVACAGNGAREELNNERRGAIRDQSMGYFDYLEQSTRSEEVIWTSPYVDNFGLGLILTLGRPVITPDGRHLGVVGVDVRLTDVEQILFSQQWGTLYSFMTNNQGEVIIHPRLTPATELISDLETPPLEMLETRDGVPNINALLEALRNGETGNITYSNIPRSVLRGEDQDGIIYAEGTTSNYFYTDLPGTDFSFAFNFENSDLTFIYPLEGSVNLSVPSIYHDLNAYSRVFPSIFNSLDVQQPRTSLDYPLTLLTMRNSTVKLAPKAFCHPNLYLREESYPNLTFVHNYLNGAGDNVGCDNPDGVFEIRARPDTYITSGMESHWKRRSGANGHLISLSYIGTNAGVVRSFPGVHWTRPYDPTTRPYYHRALAGRGRLALSYAYFDAAGAGKIVTFSEVLYLGKLPATVPECSQVANRSERCDCDMDSQCATGHCERTRCVGTQVEGVIAIDIRYNDFHTQVLTRLRSGNNPCGDNCNEQTCPTRCYVIDESSNVIFSDGLNQADQLDLRNYNRVPLGRVEPGVMRDLVREKRFFIPEPVQIDFQGVCERLNYFVPASGDGILRTAEEEDNYFAERGPLQRYQNSFGCVQDLVRFSANPSVIPAANIITGTQSTACSSGNYYLTRIPDTNTYLLVIDNWEDTLTDTNIGIGCLVERTLHSAGAYRALNATCGLLSDDVARPVTCPVVDQRIQPTCMPTGTRGSASVLHHLGWYILGIITLLVVMCQ